MHRVPVDQQRARREMLAGQPERVGVVPVLGPVVVHQREPHAVIPLQAAELVADRVRRVADHDHDVGQPHRGQVTQGDVEDRDLAVDRQQGLRQRVSVRPQPAAGAGREDHPYQLWSPTAGSNHPLRKSQQKSNQR